MRPITGEFGAEKRENGSIENGSGLAHPAATYTEIDLSLLEDSLAKTPWERMQANDDALRFADLLRAAMEKRNIQLPTSNFEPRNLNFPHPDPPPSEGRGSLQGAHPKEKGIARPPRASFRLRLALESE
jgi:hypothetical protein